MATITPTRVDLDPYFTVTWASFGGSDTCVAFDGLHAELLTAEYVADNPSNTGSANIMGSNQSTFTPANTSPNIGQVSGVDQAMDLRTAPKLRWFAPFTSSSVTQTGSVILLFGK